MQYLESDMAKPDSTRWNSHKFMFNDVLLKVIESWTVGQNEVWAVRRPYKHQPSHFFSFLLVLMLFFFPPICLSFSSQCKSYLCCVICQLFHIYSRASLCLVFLARVVKTIHCMEESTQAPIFSAILILNVKVWKLCGTELFISVRPTTPAEISKTYTESLSPLGCWLVKWMGKSFWFNCF